MEGVEGLSDESDVEDGFDPEDNEFDAAFHVIHVRHRYSYDSDRVVD